MKFLSNIASIDMNKLSILTSTTLILAISFTVLAVAGIFYTIYRKGNLLHPVAKVICLFALPFTALSMWILAGFSTLKFFESNEALSIFLAIVISFVILTIIYFIAKYVEVKNKKSKEKQMNTDLVEEISDVEEELNNLKKIIDDVIEEKPSRKKIEEEVEETKQTNIVIITDKKEETKEPETNVESKTENTENETTNVEEVVEDNKESEELSETSKDESADNNNAEKNENVDNTNEPINVEVKEVSENDESDFIKSLSRILEELENNKSNKDDE